MFQYCFEEIHSLILTSREWASQSPVSDGDKGTFVKNEPTINNSQNDLVERLNAFMKLAMLRIKDLRVQYQTKGYFCHAVGIWCDDTRYETVSKQPMPTSR
jgi:hypothetical protein